jgi:hexosaminidase
MHLDVGRHFFPVEFIKRYIDLMAMYKMNRFHWHLTEDQGWRIEIKKYPRLTEVGAFRRETILEKNFDPYVGDGERYGGFYTQDEVREIVAHAQTRYITVIPEIEMPGHSVAAIAAYPELACTDGPFDVSTIWGVHEDIYCPKEETFTFLEDVLLEVMDLFPSTYIHIGGDEAPKARWEESDVAQEVISREGLADEHELQSYFIRRIETFLRAHGRKLIGWDEILEGGLAPEATVMSWRGFGPGMEAARQGHDVIMTPTSVTYFDYYQADPESEPLAIGGLITLEDVYAFEPVPDSLSWNEGQHVLGAQANVWTEYMKTTDYVEYMVFPRMLALSEVVWTPAKKRDWDFFVSRLPSNFELLDRYGVNYRRFQQ